MIADTADLLVFVDADAEPNAVDNSAEDVQNIVGAISDNVDVDNVDFDEKGMMLDPDGCGPRTDGLWVFH